MVELSLGPVGVRRFVVGPQDDSGRWGLGWVVDI